MQVAMLAKRTPRKEEKLKLRRGSGRSSGLVLSAERKVTWQELVLTGRQPKNLKAKVLWSFPFKELFPLTVMKFYCLNLEQLTT
jgi:hypothetical protein